MNPSEKEALIQKLCENWANDYGNSWEHRMAAARTGFQGYANMPVELLYTEHLEQFGEVFICEEAREKLIEKLVDNLRDACMGDPEYFDNMVRYGITPLSEMSDEDLLQEYREQFDCEFTDQ